MKKLLIKRMQRLLAKKSKLVERSNAATDVNELRSINEELTEINEDIKDIQEELDSLDDKSEGNAEPEARSATAVPSNAVAHNASIVGSFGQNAPTVENRSEIDIRSTMEYREAFMKYCVTGQKTEILQYQKRSDEFVDSSDMGVLMPINVVQSIITDVEKVYGQLYSRVKKTNVPGGVKYPYGAFEATFKRIGEGEGSARQDAGSAVQDYIEFSYNIGEIKIARSIVVATVSVAAFEAELSKAIVDAYVKGMDTEIMVGVAANGECEGILTEAAKSPSRISASHIIEFSAADIADWEKWQKKLFAVIPLSMRKLSPEFVMTSNTYEANIKTLKDSNNRPVYNETFNPVDGAEICKFKGKNVCLVEDDILKDFDSASAGEYFGMYWVPEKAYAVNSNLNFFIKRYFDEDNNQYVDKALVINDGKVLDPKFIYLLKKKS